jgi:iron complex transport system ATP-binding protein
MNSVLDIQNITLQYDETAILDNVSFQVSKGDFFVIIGPNGAGKTSLLKIFAGLEDGWQGTVSCGGKNLADYTRKELSQVVAMVPQHVDTDFPFTVAETVIMGRTPHLGLLGLESKEDYLLANRAMEFTDIGHLAKRRLDQISGGELQRVIIARAICQQPQVILLDEPTAALDPHHQLKIMDLMEQLRQEESVTVIMVSHDLNLASLYGNRLLLLKDGRIIKTGTPGDVLSEKLLQQSYGCTMLVDENPVGQGARVTPVPKKYLDKPRKYRDRQHN